MALDVQSMPNSVSVYITKRLKDALTDHPQVGVFAFAFNAVFAKCGLCMCQKTFSYATLQLHNVIEEVDKLVQHVVEFAEEHKHGIIQDKSLYGVNQGQGIQNTEGMLGSGNYTYYNKKSIDNLKANNPFKPGQIVPVDNYKDYQNLSSPEPIVKFASWSQDIIKEIYRNSDFNVDLQQQANLDGAKVRLVCNKCSECLGILDYQPFINNTYKDSQVWKDILVFCKDHRHDLVIDSTQGRSGRKFKNI